MKTKRSRLALLGVLALTFSVVTGGVAEAQKKGKTKKGGSVTATSGGGIVPAAVPISPTDEVAGQAIFTANVPNKKTKGKVVSPNSLTATYAISGTPTAGPPSPGGPGFIAIELQHRGRATFLNTPGDDGTALIGRVTVSPNTNVGFCTPSVTPPPPPCADPANSCLRPYACTVQDNSLTIFNLQKAKGPVIFRVLNFGSVPVTVNQLSATMNMSIVTGLG
jgi:hypothetical protein